MPVGQVHVREPHVLGLPNMAYGLTSDGQRGGLASASYPYLFCVVLACAHLQLAAPGVDTTGVSPLVVPGHVPSAKS